METWLETGGVLALNFVNQKKKKPSNIFTVFHQYHALLFFELKPFLWDLNRTSCPEEHIKLMFPQQCDWKKMLTLCLSMPFEISTDF